MIRQPRAWLRALFIPAVIAGPVACGGDGGGVRMVAVRDTVGDTIVVRTTAGSVWGDTRVLMPEVSIGVLDGADEYMFGSVAAIAVTPDEKIFVLDNQVPAVRLYGADGVHIKDVGRSGEGPGEYERPDGGMVYLPPGRVVVRDPGTGKILEFSPEGDHVRDIRLPYGGGFSTSNNFYWDTAGNLYTFSILNLSEGVPVTEWRRGLIRFGPDGAVIDSLERPTYDFEEWVVSAQREGSSSTTGVPLAPGVETAYSPLGYWVAGLSTDYRIDLQRTDGPWIRIERDWEPVPVNSEEADTRRRQIRENFRNNYPGWSWNGPDIPANKPPFSGILVSEEGRIWVVVPSLSEEIMSVADAREEEEATGRPANRFGAPLAFDVFEPNGDYLGRVEAPLGMSLTPRPVIRGDLVWAVMRDELDVPQVTRFRVSRMERP